MSYFFKAIVAGFRGKVALEIGHLAFQVYIFLLLMWMFPLQ